MSLFGTLQIANNALIAQQLGLQVTGNNIANANTPGYVREQLILSPAPTQRYGGVLIGLGVEVEGIRQKTDRFLEERLRTAAADLANVESQEDTYIQLESLIGELTNTDLSTTISKFFGSIHDILNQPESLSIRNIAITQGQRLTSDISSLESRVREIRREIDKNIANAAADINRLVEKISELNVQISTFEGGNVSKSDAVGLRDERSRALGELAKLINVRAYEQESGAITVYAGGDYLVHEGQFREVYATFGFDRGISVSELLIKDSNSTLEVSSGQIAGYTNSRDDVLGGFLDDLNSLTQTLAFEFNKVYSGGQGLTGYTTTTSERAVAETDVALDAASLPFVPVNGSLQLQVYNKQTKTTKTTDVLVKLNGLDDDTTLDDLADSLDAIDGVTATITADRKLKIVSDSANLEFAFANDTSGILAALGINTFFSGSEASDIAVNETLLDDPTKFAASSGGIGADTNNAVTMAAFLDQPLDTQNGQSLANLYDNFIGNLAQAGSATRSLAEGQRAFHATLESQQLSISGVSLDEEAVKMMTYQRAYQASARFIRTISELLETLVNL